MTLIEMFDAGGTYLPREWARKVEGAFGREEFRRVDSDDLGHIQFASRAQEEYVEDDFHELSELDTVARLRIVCDYGYGPLASAFPAMLERMGLDAIALHAVNDPRRAPRSREEVREHLENLRGVVRTLDYDLEDLFLQKGKRLVLVDRLGEAYAGHRLTALLATLVLPGGTKG